MKKEVREGYKITELGEIPDGWEIVNTGDIFDFSGGLSISRANLGNEGILYLHYGDIHKRNENYIHTEIDAKWLPRVEANYEELKDGLKLSTGTVVFADASEDYDGIGKSVVIFNEDEMPFVAGLHTIVAKDEENKLDSNYKRYCFETKNVRKQFRALANGTSVYGISRENIKKIKILNPPIQEQKKIAEILSTVDEQIENTEKLIQKNQELKKGLMQQLLTKGIGHTEFKETELGYIPKCWDIKRLGECADIVSGATPKTNIKEYWDNGNIHWATPTDITSSGKYINKTEKFITDSGLKNCSAKILPIGSILMSSRATIGERSLNTVPMATNQGFKSLICKSIVDNEFIYYYIEVLKERFIRLASGSTFLEISKKLVEDTKIIVPNLEEQKKIASILALIDEKIYRYENKKEKLEELKNGLMQSLMTGKIRVI
ncbi:restriction endonuclease subunit S [Clostridium perfringens]|uniref:restriction endonuclease subunit S n=1 Tax=Clostridium perfringens TaxID=1502 RepID=UPI0018E4B646|nr:restriction endonuclease subunit S [Clostridium perfringens]MBI6093053.1 restriction endonuclease subunit S [Clostridium perfringens]